MQLHSPAQNHSCCELLWTLCVWIKQSTLSLITVSIVSALSHTPHTLRTHPYLFYNPQFAGKTSRSQFCFVDFFSQFFFARKRHEREEKIIEIKSKFCCCLVAFSRRIKQVVVLEKTFVLLLTFSSFCILLASLLISRSFSDESCFRKCRSRQGPWNLADWSELNVQRWTWMGRQELQ